MKGCTRRGQMAGLYQAIAQGNLGSTGSALSWRSYSDVRATERLNFINSSRRS